MAFAWFTPAPPRHPSPISGLWSTFSIPLTHFHFVPGPCSFLHTTLQERSSNLDTALSGRLAHAARRSGLSAEFRCRQETQRWRPSLCLRAAVRSAPRRRNLRDPAGTWMLEAGCASVCVCVCACGWSFIIPFNKCLLAQVPETWGDWRENCHVPNVTPWAADTAESPALTKPVTCECQQHTHTSRD